MASSAATSPEGEAGLEADDAPLFLGLDFGTSGARGTVVDSQGGIVHELAAAYPPIVGGGKGGDGVPEGGWVEAWRGALWALLDKLPRTVAAQITAVSVDGTSGTVLIVDAVTGEPLCAPMLYNEKRADALPAVEAMAPEGHTVRSATSALCKLHSWWVSNGSNSSSSGDSSLASDRQLGTTQPITGVALDGDRQLSTTQPTSGSGVGARLLHHADWVAFLLHGEMGVSDHNNALKLGFDPGAGVDGKGAYPPWLLAAPYADMLPSRVLPPGTAAAAVSSVSGLARLGTGTGKKVVVVAGTTDSVAAFVAARCTAPGDAVTSLGSSLALKLVSKTRVDDSSKGVYSHRLCGNWLVGGASNLGGWVLRSNFSDEEVARLTIDMDLAVEDTDTARNIPDYYPGVLLGFGLSVEEATAALTPRPPQDVDFLRAILGSVACVEARSYAALVDMGASHPVARVLTAGGGAKNDKWSAIRSKAMGGVPVVMSRHAEASYGAALLARMGHFELPTYVPEEQGAGDA